MALTVERQRETERERERESERENLLDNSDTSRSNWNRIREPLGTSWP
jgi:hypothetical protein